MRQFDDTLQFIGAIQAAETPEAVTARLLGITSRFGLTSLMAGTVPDPRTPAKLQKNHVLLNKWPVDWLQRYVARNYVDHDPLVTFMKRTPAPVRWSAAAAGITPGPVGRQVYGDASEFRLNDGVAFPLITLEGNIMMVSLGGEAIDPSPETFNIVSLIATYAVGRAMQLQSDADLVARRPHLTLRERECLKWAAEGKSEREISEILGVSEHTSEKHLLNAKAKLGAVNRVHAVAEAIRLGYIF